MNQGRRRSVCGRKEDDEAGSRRHDGRWGEWVVCGWDGKNDHTLHRTASSIKHSLHLLPFPFKVPFLVISRVNCLILQHGVTYLGSRKVLVVAIRPCHGVKFNPPSFNFVEPTQNARKPKASRNCPHFILECSCSTSGNAPHHSLIT